MLITKSSAILGPPTGYRCLDTQDRAFYWKGIIYLQGETAGERSVEKFAREMAHDLSGKAEHLKGFYFLAIHDKRTGSWYAFVDNSGMFHAFYSDHAVSTSFIDLARYERLGSDDIDPRSLVEFFHFGVIHFGDTLFPQIHRIAPNKIVCIHSDGTIASAEKMLADLDSPPAVTFFDSLHALATALPNESVSLDLTGGFDSRLLAVMLRHFGLSYELAVSGVDGNTEIVISREVARVLGRECYVTYHTVDDLESELQHILPYCDGLCDPLKYHRAFLLQRDRVQRGITVMVSGVGGGLYKDFFWLQDFPLFNRRRANIIRLYDSRIAPIALKHHYLSESYRSYSQNYREDYLRRLSTFAVPGSIHSYDRIFYARVQDSSGRFLTNHQPLLQTLAPYMEREAVVYGYHLPISERVLSTFHRRTITCLLPEAGRIRTTFGGVTASSESRFFLKNLACASLLYGTRAFRKFGQRVLSKSYLQESADNPGLYSRARWLPCVRQAFDCLHDYRILNHSVSLSDVNDSYIGRILNLAWCLQQVRGAERARAATS